MAAENQWWPAALSEEVTAAKPFNVDVGEQPVVLWRDAQGVARALEDRCPHRRAPLSRGCVLPDGNIQCGYHGWTFDGASGRLVNIPNLKGGNRFPPTYRAAKFAVAEAAGFVRLCLDGAASEPETTVGATFPLSGRSEIAIPHEHFIATLFDEPDLLIAIPGVRFTPYLMAELHEEDGLLVLERSCQWAGPRWPAAFSPEFPLTLRIATHPTTGESELRLRDTAMRELLRVVLSPVPAPRGVTQALWRARTGERRPAMMGWGLASPFALRRYVDGAKLRVVKPSASVQAAAIRARIAGDEPARLLQA